LPIIKGKVKVSVLRRSSPATERDTRTVFQRSFNRPPPSRQLGPSLGSWVADPTKPIAVIDNTGKRMIIYAASRKPSVHHRSSSDSSIAGTSPHASFGTLIDDSENSDYSSQEYAGALFSSGANLMMGGLLQGPQGMGDDFLFPGQALGPPEAFYPFVGVGTNSYNQADFDDDEDEDDEDLWNITDFVDFGDGSSSEDNDGFLDTETPNSPMTPGFQSQTPTASSVVGTPGSVMGPPASPTKSTDLLNHFGKGVVGAFRQNQHRHKQQSSARPREFHNDVASAMYSRPGIRSDRVVAANQPITPIRRRGTNNLFSGAPSMSPPIGGVAKRGLSGHQRSRSAI
jgi:hypothetical protein